MDEPRFAVVVVDESGRIELLSSGIRILWPGHVIYPLPSASATIIVTIAFGGDPWDPC